MLSKFKAKFSKRPDVHIFHLDGVIGFSSQNFTNNTKLEKLLEELNELDSDTAGVLLRINSPGGSAGASEELAQTILKLRDKNIPVIASVGDMACSGAYMVAACCDYIFANRMSILGSIGVIMQIPNFKGLSEKLGATVVTVKAGTMKDIGNSFRDMTDEEREYLETLTQKAHRDFINLVAGQRKIKDLENMTDGRIIDAETALNNGLIDNYGTFHDALQYFAETKLHTEIDKLNIVKHEPKKSLISRILGTCNVNISVSTLNDLFNRW